MKCNTSPVANHSEFSKDNEFWKNTPQFHSLPLSQEQFGKA